MLSNDEYSMRFINCHTPNYADVAENLVQSLDDLGLDYEIEVFDSKGSWAQNCQYKADFIYKMWQKHGIVVWLDADCQVKKDPALFRVLQSDIAFHRFKGKELLSGTLFFGDTDNAEKILKAWIEVNKQFPFSFDQKNLDLALRKLDVRIDILPPEYCFIFDLSKDYYGSIEPVIEHYQASREKK